MLGDSPAPAMHSARNLTFQWDIDPSGEGRGRGLSEGAEMKRSRARERV